MSGAHKTLERTGAPRYSFARMENSTLDRQSLSALPAPVAQLGRYVPKSLMSFKAIVLLPALLVLASCSSVSVGSPSKVVTHQSGSIDTKHSPTVFLRIKADTERLHSDISARLEGLGFTAVTTTTADYYADVDYATYWDVVHQTFKHFDIELVDAGSGEKRIETRYIGRGSFNGCRAALDMVFRDLRKHINGT